MLEFIHVIFSVLLFLCHVVDSGFPVLSCMYCLGIFEEEFCINSVLVQSTYTWSWPHWKDFNIHLIQKWNSWDLEYPLKSVLGSIFQRKALTGCSAVRGNISNLMLHETQPRTELSQFWFLQGNLWVCYSVTLEMRWVITFLIVFFSL